MMSDSAVASAFAPRLWTGLPSGVPFDSLLGRYSTSHPALKPVSLQQLAVVASQVEQWASSQEWFSVPLVCDEVFQLDRLEAWVKWLFDQPKTRGARPGDARSIRTVKGKRSYFLMLWKYASRKGLCDRPIPDRDDLALLKPPDEDPEAWSVEQMSIIMNQCREAPPVEWWRAAHWLSLLWADWYTVERIGALLSCTLSDLQGDVLYVRACRTKDKKAGVHRLNPKLCELIRSLPMLAGCNLPATHTDLIWPWPHKIGALRSHYRSDILRPAGLPDDAKHLFHCIRRSGLTEMVNQAGIAAAQELARHSGPSLTLDRYVSKRLLRTESASDILPDPTRRAPEQLALF